MKRKYKLVFTEETVTDEGVVINKKPLVVGQICISEYQLQNMIIPDLVISRETLHKLYEGIMAELENPNQSLNKKTEEISLEEPKIEPVITPLYPQN